MLLHDRNDSDVPGRIVLSNILGQNRSHAENRSHGHNRSHENERSLAPKPKYVQKRVLKNNDGKNGVLLLFTQEWHSHDHTGKNRSLSYEKI